MSASGAFDHVSFVNGIATSRGGTHVNYLAEQICRRVAEHVNRKHRDITVNPSHVKSCLSLHVKSLIENPSFDSQTKEFLVTKPQDYGSSAVLSKAFTSSVISDTGIVEAVVDAASARARTGLVRAKRGSSKARLAGIPKLQDANHAGGPQGHECTLILTEGDSAKALAVAGLSVVGRDK